MNASAKPAKMFSEILVSENPGDKRRMVCDPKLRLSQPSGPIRLIVMAMLNESFQVIYSEET